MDGTVCSQELLLIGMRAASPAAKPSVRDMRDDAMPFSRPNVKHFQRGQVVAMAGTVVDKFARIHKGTICASTILADGREFIVELIPQGQNIGELEVLRKQAFRFEYRAASDCELHFFEGRALRKLYANDPSFQEEVLSRALARVSELEFRIISSAGLSLQARLAGMLLRLVAVYGQDSGSASNELTISQQDLAATLPASREKVNQCLRRLRTYKIIEAAHGKIRILNRKALEDCAMSTSSLSMKCRMA